MATKSQLFEKVKNQVNSLFIQSILNDCNSPRELKKDIEYNLYFWNHLLSQCKQGKNVQWYLGDKYYAHKALCERNILALENLATKMQYQVINTEYNIILK